MKKTLGIFVLLVAVCAFTAMNSDNFLSAYNVQNTVRWTGLFGVIGVGAALVIITGGIDLSIGSVIGLTGALLAMLLGKGYSPWIVVPGLLAGSALIGLAHGLLITRMKLQPFVVTLCSLLYLRGFARYATGDQSVGFGSNFPGLGLLANGSVPIGGFALPVPFISLIVVALIAGFFLNFTIYGRYLLALGRNEEAARFSGINTARVTIGAYVACSVLAGFSGMVFALDLNTVQPAGMGEFYELFAIAAAVLGGCSLRGGEGSILGVVIGTAVIRVLYNAINILGLPSQLEFAIIGVVLLAGVMADELVKRVIAKRRAIISARAAAT
ncbi:MAG: ABC transporter permease [Candidatus Hydrogenedentes bacterium]|nr:ABC transporter permease [Candidatus Hydrogenedentota bacterium]